VRRDSPGWAILKSVSHALPASIRSRVTIKGVLENFSRRNSDVFFVQVGSFNGIDNDPLHEFIVREKWAGLMVEPYADAFSRLRETYRGCANLIFENVALAETEGPKSFWYLKTRPDSPSWYGQLSSLRPDVIRDHANLIPDFDSLLTSKEVYCTTLPALFHKHRIEKLDLLHLDTEGYDFELLQTLDFGAFRPAILLFEHSHLTEAEKHNCAHLLRSAGYKLLEEGADSIAFL
jgi:FkbM family methyltransferase